MPPAQAPKRLRTKHLDVVRNGNDDYTLTEYELESADGKAWRTAATRVICARKSRNVATDYAREWHSLRVGRNGTAGDFE